MTIEQEREEDGEMGGVVLGLLKDLATFGEVTIRPEDERWDVICTSPVP